MNGQDTIEVELTADELAAALVRLAPERGACVLDSCGARGDGARFLVAGFDPFETIEARGEQLRLRARGESSSRVVNGSALSLLDARLAEQRLSQAPSADLPARGACIAALSYDLVRQFEKLRPRAPSLHTHDRDPDAVLAFFDTLVVHDYARGVTRIVGVREGVKRLEEARAALLAAAAEAPDTSRGETVTSAESNFTRDEYVAAVGRIKEHIYAGNIYQANLTQQIRCPPRSDVTPERVFTRLRREHPAAFAAFLRLPDGGAVVSASPERFLRVCLDDSNDERRRVVEAWPIKGTRPRGRDAAGDALLRAELLSSAKDRAENVMIVDLLRNDLGRVCRYGTVEVAELCALQEHPTLFHLVSKVRGRLREGVTAGELLRAAFPCGSITGAPKIRAMQIIDEMETAPRGFSMGALGYFSFDGAIDLSVAIRTVTFAPDGAARFNVGGGVVAESDPAAEYDESLLKARALLRALNAQLRTEERRTED